MKTTKFFNAEDRKWVVVDAKNQILGRLATQIAKVLQGKTKPTYSPNSLCGDKVIVVNAKDIQVTGNKHKGKIYDKYTGYPSGRKEMNLQTLAAKNPTRLLYSAVKGMLPKNNMGRQMLKSFKIYAEAEHKQHPQKPETITV
jgi:large subunit ribosomal protein L13